MTVTSATPGTRSQGSPQGSQQEEQEENRLLAAAMHAVTECAVIALDVEGCIRTWNLGAEQLTGYRRDEIIGRHCSTFYPDEDAGAGKPERDLAVAVAEGGYEEEGWRVRKDGTRFWANVLTTAVRGEGGRLEGFGKLIRDFTERKRGEDALRESEERFALLVSGVADYAIFLLTPEGTVASWNLGAERLKGYRADEIIGRHFSLFYSAKDRTDGLPDTALREALQHGRWESEGWRVRKDGTRFWADVVITALRGADGTHRGFAKITRDLTDRKRSEDALRGVLARERESAVRLHELDRMRTELMAIVAHDLRAPVGVVRSMLHLAGDDWAATSERDRQDLILRARRRIDELASFVDDVFDMARIESGDLRVEQAPFDLAEVVDRVTADAAVTWASCDVVAHIDPLAVAVGDPQRTWQILCNLVSNACKFSPTGSPVELTVAVVGDEVVISVTDHGIGIPEEEAGLLFQRFSRLPQAAGTPGSGIGLFIARSLAEAQGGRLWLEPGNGPGCTFRFALPRALP